MANNRDHRPKRAIKLALRNLVTVTGPGNRKSMGPSFSLGSCAQYGIPIWDPEIGRQCKAAEVQLHVYNYQVYVYMYNYTCYAYDSRRHNMFDCSLYPAALGSSLEQSTTPSTYYRVPSKSLALMPLRRVPIRISGWDDCPQREQKNII
ncbi:unnamed protein product [Phytophthora lilii]|uniref:Unnamed protein product n=1 Tax=Phytophthora lilii TaxID=2077276 RepID=A0A9W6YJ03_9STRA|nr:unnamed protein product [Phytophthora lilii]